MNPEPTAQLAAARLSVKFRPQQLSTRVRGSTLLTTAQALPLALSPTAAHRAAAVRVTRTQDRHRVRLPIHLLVRAIRDQADTRTLMAGQVIPTALAATLTRASNAYACRNSTGQPSLS